MSSTLVGLPEITNIHSFNAERWDELLDDTFLATLDQRIATDRYGHIVMIPPPGFGHSRLQGRITKLLDRLMTASGEAQPECPLSTSEGVKGVDIVWISDERASRALQGNLLVEAPEICIEVLSPKNTKAEIEEKQRLYFEAGATEVWICDGQGIISFYLPDGEMENSELCPDFPSQIETGLS